MVRSPIAEAENSGMLVRTCHKALKVRTLEEHYSVCWVESYGKLYDI